MHVGSEESEAEAKLTHFKVGFKIQTVERYRKRKAGYLHGIRTHRKP